MGRAPANAERAMNVHTEVVGSPVRPSAGQPYQSLFVTAQDGLRLHVRAYGPRIAPGVPVVCLPGLARTGADFDVLANALANDASHGRRVLAVESRGRGRSSYDRKPGNYTVQTELADLLAVLTALGIGLAAFVGTSRGGILTMMLAASRPGAIAGAVLNDIGPVIEPRGLMRIRGYVGKLPQPRSYQDAADTLRRLFSGQFPKLSDADWLGWARRTYREDKGRLIADYDPALGRTLAGIDLESPLPTMWNQFAGMPDVPLMVIRGANSDLLTAVTVAEMRRRRPGLELLEVADQGHAPLLAEPEVIAKIARFVARCDSPRDR
jgi:pimeloyl-ACP methyl ester carboxylesterase